MSLKLRTKGEIYLERYYAIIREHGFTMWKGINEVTELLKEIIKHYENKDVR